MTKGMDLSHLAQVISIHEICFPDSQSTKYGKHFLKAYYKGVCISQNSVAFVSIVDEKVVGFVAGGVNKQALSRQILSGSKFLILISFLENFIKHPTVTVKKFWSYCRAYILPNKKETFYSLNTSVLDSIALLPEYRGKGIAEELVGVFLEELKRRGNSACRLGVEADNMPARKFYEKMKFEQANETGSIYIYYFNEEYRNL